MCQLEAKPRVSTRKWAFFWYCDFFYFYCPCEPMLIRQSFIGPMHFTMWWLDYLSLFLLLKDFGFIILYLINAGTPCFSVTDSSRHQLSQRNQKGSSPCTYPWSDPNIPTSSVYMMANSDDIPIDDFVLLQLFKDNLLNPNNNTPTAASGAKFIVL